MSTETPGISRVSLSDETPWGCRVIVFGLTSQSLLECCFIVDVFDVVVVVVVVASFVALIHVVSSVLLLNCLVDVDVRCLLPSLNS